MDINLYVLWHFFTLAAVLGKDPPGVCFITCLILLILFLSLHHYMQFIKDDDGTLTAFERYW
jgi:hypothetical protein